MVHGKVAEHTRLNLYFLRKRFPFYLVSRLKLVALHDVLAFKHLYTGLIKVTVEDDRCRAFGIQPAAFGLFNPLVAVTVAVEMYRSAGANILANHVENGRKLILARCHELVNTLFKAGECFGNGGVQHNLRTGTIGRRAYRAELKAVACKRKGRRTVAVGIVAHDVGYLRNVNMHALLTFDKQRVFVGFFDMFQQIGHATAQETRYNSRRSFVGSQPVAVACIHD